MLETTLCVCCQFAHLFGGNECAPSIDVMERWLIAFSVLLALGAGAAFFLYVSVLYIIVGIAICVGALLFFVLGYSARMREKASRSSDSTAAISR